MKKPVGLSLPAFLIFNCMGVPYAPTPHCRGGCVPPVRVAQTGARLRGSGLFNDTAKRLTTLYVNWSVGAWLRASHAHSQSLHS